MYIQTNIYVYIRYIFFVGQFRFIHTYFRFYVAVVVAAVSVVPCGVCVKRFNYICMLKLQLTPARTPVRPSAHPSGRSFVLSPQTLLNFNRVVCDCDFDCGDGWAGVAERLSVCVGGDLGYN